MVAVLAGNRRRQSDDESRLGLAHDLFEALGGQMVTLVHDHVSVVGDAIVHYALSHEALNNRHIDATRQLDSAPLRCDR